MCLMTRPLRPEKVIAELDTAHVAGYLLDGQAGMALMLAIWTIDAYLAEAAVQEARLRRERRVLTRQMEELARTLARGEMVPRTRGRSRANRFRAVHFYLSCWRIIDLHLTLVQRLSQLPEVRNALRPYRHTFRAYEKMRHHYEHFDERLPGQKHAKDLAVPGDLGNFAGHMLTFGGESVDVGPESLRLLKKIVGQALFAFKAAAVEKLAAEQPESLQGLLMPIRAKRITRHVERLLRRTPRAARSG